MWCHFIKDDRTITTKELRCLSVQEAIEQSGRLFEEMRHAYDTFEVWERGQIVYKHERLAPECETKVAVWPAVDV